MEEISHKKIIFLMSFGHTGIDWLHSLFNGHPQILILPVFSPYRSWKRLNAANIRSPQEMIALWQDFFSDLDNHHDFFNSKEEFLIFKTTLKEKINFPGLTCKSFVFACHHAYCQAKKINLENIQTIVVHEHVCFPFEQIIKDFPKAQFLFIIRDPRAAIAGYFRGMKRKFGNTKPDFYDHYINLSLEEWLMAIDIKKKYQHILHHHFKIVRNEDLCLNLHQGMKDIANWMNIDFKQSLTISKQPDGSPWKPDSCYVARDESLPSPVHSFYSPENVEKRWRSELSDPREIILIEFLFRKIMKEFHYDEISPDNFVTRVKGLYYFIKPHRGEMRLGNYPVIKQELDRLTQSLRQPKIFFWNLCPRKIKNLYIVSKSVLSRIIILLFPGNRWKRYDHGNYLQ